MHGSVSAVAVPIAQGTFVFKPEVRWLNHRVFRYPAKFHPAVARQLVRQYSEPGAVVGDPFCGSGTLLVECLAEGRNSIGSDIDPLATLISRAKTRRYDVHRLKREQERLADTCALLREVDLSRHGSFKNDIAETDYLAELAQLGLLPPHIGRLHHWFRRRVVLQLLRLKETMSAGSGQPDDRLFFSMCFAAIIRNASNADPVPVSGLEVTSHMLKKEAAGREVDPYTLFRKAISRAVQGTEALDEAIVANSSWTRVAERDAARSGGRAKSLDAIITSPPYLSAVDYYRRHQLEMFWLGLVESQEQRLALLPKYIGRGDVTNGRLAQVRSHLPSSGIVAEWRPLLHDSPRHLRTLEHYAAMMKMVFRRQAPRLRTGGKFVVIVGDNNLRGHPFPTVELLQELARPQLHLKDWLWYPIQNRYMSYARRNGADIAREHVLVFERNRRE